MSVCIIRTSYTVVTEESAEQGDCAEQGWLDEDGTEYSFDEAVDLLRDCEPSSTSFHPGVWYCAEPSQDYSTGDWEGRDYHIDASTQFQARLFKALQGKR